MTFIPIRYTITYKVQFKNRRAILPDHSTFPAMGMWKY